MHAVCKAVHCDVILHDCVFYGFIFDVTHRCFSCRCHDYLGYALSTSLINKIILHLYKNDFIFDEYRQMFYDWVMLHTILPSHYIKCGTFITLGSSFFFFLKKKSKIDKQISCLHSWTKVWFVEFSFMIKFLMDLD